MRTFSARLPWLGLLSLAALLLLSPPASAANIFSVGCFPSHSAMDDPIVSPGQPGHAHQHQFSGAWSTDAYSSFSSLQRSGTTCLTNQEERSRALADKSAYWAPALYQRGQPVSPGQTSIYLSPGPNNSVEQLAKLQRFPDGLKIIADMVVSSRNRVDGWNCGGNYLDSIPSQSSPPDCSSSSGQIQAHISFPTCWDGLRLDSPDHRAHMSYTPEGRSGCPASHPVYLPEMSVKHTFQHNGSGGGFTISGHDAHHQPSTLMPPSSFHADFFNGWEASELNFLIDYCLKQGRAQSNTRPCLGPAQSETEINTRNSWALNPNSPQRTPPGEAAPPPPSNGPVWSESARTLAAGEEIPIPDRLGRSESYTLHLRFKGNPATAGQANLMMIGNRASDYASIYMSGSKAKIQLVSGGVAVNPASKLVDLSREHEYALVRNGNKLLFYVDKLLVSETSGLWAPHDLGPGALGAYREGDGFYANAPGFYASAALYARALSGQEIQSLSP